MSLYLPPHTPPLTREEAMSRLRGWLATLPVGTRMRESVAECLICLEREDEPTDKAQSTIVGTERRD